MKPSLLEEALALRLGKRQHRESARRCRTARISTHDDNFGWVSSSGEIGRVRRDNYLQFRASANFLA
ncbi:hypothetical protein BIU92_10670 [Curtobacterium sp. MCBA15_003]|nr:hypothetical protein BIU92_10670 [Curtobacterium sp. MCBA15_003]OII33349.1 hypothetical protein BIU94_14730 [Curtobacterium sp. MMLR14_006]